MCLFWGVRDRVLLWCQHWLLSCASLPCCAICPAYHMDHRADSPGCASTGIWAMHVMQCVQCSAAVEVWVSEIIPWQDDKEDRQRLNKTVTPLGADKEAGRRGKSWYWLLHSPCAAPKSRNIILGTDHATVTLIIFYWWCLLLKFQNIGFPPCHHTTNPPCHYFTLPPCHHTPCYYIIPYQCHISNSNVFTGCLLFCWSARLNKKGTLESGQQAAHYRYRCKLF